MLIFPQKQPVLVRRRIILLLLLLGTFLSSSIGSSLPLGFVGAFVVVVEKRNTLNTKRRQIVCSAFSNNNQNYNNYKYGDSYYENDPEENLRPKVSYRDVEPPLQRQTVRLDTTAEDPSFPRNRRPRQRQPRNYDWYEPQAEYDTTDNFFNNDYNNEESSLQPSIHRRNQNRQSATPDEFLEEPEEEIEYLSYSDKEPGNYWSNPADIDDDDVEEDEEYIRFTSQRNRPQRSSTSSLASFRSWASPRPPKPLVDLYHRLFWYGLEEDDDESDGTTTRNGASPADRTMFGGTKGKFNGLAYLYDTMDTLYERVPPAYQRNIPPRRRRRRNRNTAKDEEEDMDYEEDDYYYEPNREEEQDDTTTASVLPLRVPVTPPYDSPRPMMKKEGNNGIPKRQTTPPTTDSFTRHPQRTGYTSASRRRKGMNQEEGNNNPVNSWFMDTNEETAKQYEYDEYDDYDDERRSSSTERRRIRDIASPQRKREQSQRQRRSRDVQPSSSWNVPLPDVWDTFLGVDRRELQNKAYAYENTIGRRSVNTKIDTPPLGEPKPRRSEEKEKKRRYRFVDNQEDDKDESRFAMDVDSVLPEMESPFANQESLIIDAEPIVHEIDQEDDKRNNENTYYKSSWEERALAVERVPPADIPAWGPSGELDGIDARTKALSDALEDIQLAKQKVQECQRKVEISKEAVAIARVDAELERNQQQQQLSLLEQMEDDFDQDLYDDYDNYEYRRPRDGMRSQNRRRQRQIILDRLRRLDRNADEAARKLRLDEMRLAAAEEELQDIQSRHWALLSFYDPDRAELIVEESFRELEDIEPAVRRYSENKQRKEQEQQ